MSLIEVGGATLEPLPQRAVWWPAERTLSVVREANDRVFVVADNAVHALPSTPR